MRIGHQAPPIFVNVRTYAKLPRRSRAFASLDHRTFPQNRGGMDYKE
jgi:hypothetical protein